MAKNVDPVIPYLAGWLFGMLTAQGHKALKLRKTEIVVPDGLRVHLASGRVLRVTVALEEGEEDSRDA